MFIFNSVVLHNVTVSKRIAVALVTCSLNIVQCLNMCKFQQFPKYILYICILGISVWFVYFALHQLSLHFLIYKNCTLFN